MAWRPDPGNKATDAFQQKWEHLFPYAFPPFALINRTLESKQRSAPNNSCNANMADSTVVCHSPPHVNKKSNTSAPLQDTTTGLRGKFAYTNRIRKIKIGGVDGFRQTLAKEGISDEAATHISHCRRKGSLSNYESAWRKWSSCCGERQVDPIRCSINFALDFLANLYNKGYEYRTINSHRSAISAYHMPVVGQPVGKHHRVCSLLTGVFNNKPPKPRYFFIWDVEKVLAYLEKLPSNKDLSDKLMTHKLAMLSVLTSASRCYEVNILNIEFMTRSEDRYTFHFDKLFKSCRYGRPPPSIEFFHFPQNKNLCVVEAIDYYLNLSKSWRTSDKNQLFLSVINPRKEVTSSTISGWINQVLKESGIDTTKFTSHSTRSASSSKAKVMGLALKDILKRGNWSNESTWPRYYHKSIANPSQDYQNTVMQGHALN